MKRQVTEKNIIESFCSLLVYKKISDITAKDVYEVADISRSTFYNYYSTVGQLQQSVLSFIFDEISIILAQNLVFDPPVILKVLKFMSANRKIYYPMLTAYPEIDDIITDYIKQTVLESDIDDLNSKLENGYKIPSQYALEIYVLAVKAIIVTWVRNDFKESPDLIADMIYESVPF